MAFCLKMLSQLEATKVEEKKKKESEKASRQEETKNGENKIKSNRMNWQLDFRNNSCK